MKQRFFLLCMLTVLSSLNVLAYDFESDGIYYTITGSNTVSVVSGDYVYEGDVTIPQAVGLSGKTYLVTAIGENAFQSTTALESITLPEGLTIIGNQAFYKSGVKTVNLPSTLSSMGASAFRECKNLTGIELPNALKNIKEYAFYQCSNLKILTLGEQIVTIEGRAFSNVSIESLTIPSTVVSIGDEAFLNCDFLRTLVIDNAATSLGGKAFGECDLLENVSLGNYITSFGNVKDINQTPYGPFAGCANLVSIDIPASLTSISGGAFRGCIRLKNISIPNTVTEIEQYAFYGCTELTQISLPESISVIGNVAFRGSSLQSIVFPSSLKTIGESAFFGTLLTEVTFPSSMTDIEAFAFRECKNLKKITIENSPLRIVAAFPNCSALEEVNLGNAVVGLESKFNGGWTMGCFENCIRLTSVILPNTLTTLPGRTFVGCIALENVQLPNTLKTIGSQEFDGCKNLASITIPNTVQRIESGAFANCYELNNLILPTSLTSIGGNAFQNCTKLSEILIPEQVTEIGTMAFAGCTQLRNLIVDNALAYIDAGAFQYCTNLENVDLGKATELRSSVFLGCTKLEKIVIPNTVQSNRYNSDEIFSGCTALKEISIGSAITSIGTNYFKGCIKLEKVEFKGNAITAIYGSAFRDCRSLKKIVLPESLKEMADNCFTGCLALSHIYMNPTTPPTIQANTFPDYDTPTLHVPSSVKTAYTKADNWKLFKNVIAIGSEPKATAEEIAALETLVGEAEALYNAAVEGTEPGNYRPGAKAALKAVITEVSGRINTNMLTEDVEDCTELLNTAIKSFKNKQVKNEYQTDNTLAFASSLKASRGSEFHLPIEMNNVNEISGVQFDLYLPEGMLLSTDEYGDYQIELSERTTTRRHSVSSRVMSDGALRVVVSSTQNATFTGNSGTLLSLVLFPQSTMEAGDYGVELKNIVLTDPQATRYAAADMKSVITVSAYTMGDVNNDTHIDVADLTGVVLFILENADASLVFNAADMDGNGVVEVNDYAALVNVILAQNAPAGSRMSGKMEIYPNIISLSDMMVNENGEGELIVNLINKDRSYTGLQFDLYLPEGILLNSETAEAVGRHHGIWAQKHADGYYRVVCSSMMNDELNEGAVMRLQVKAANDMQGAYRVQAGNVVLSDVNAQRHEAANAGAQLMIGDEATGIVSIETAKQLKNVYDMQGRRVNAVKKGVYMVNGKKVVVR